MEKTTALPIFFSIQFLIETQSQKLGKKCR